MLQHKLNCCRIFFYFHPEPSLVDWDKSLTAVFSSPQKSSNPARGGSSPVEKIAMRKTNEPLYVI